MSSQPKEAQKRSWGGRTLLIVSLAANLFLAGMIAGNFQRGPGKGNFPPGPFPMMLMNSPMEFRRAITDPEVGAKLKSTLDESRPLMRGAMRNTFEARSTILAALKAEPFDPQALSDAFEDSRNADDAVRLIAQESIQSFIVSLTPEQRKQVVAELEKMPMRPMRPGGKFRNRDGRNGFSLGPGDRFEPAGRESPDDPSEE